MRTGRLPSTPSDNVAKVVFADDSLPKVFSWLPTTGTLPIWMNDTLDCCCISAVAAAVYTWTSNAQAPMIAKNSDICLIYSRFGYVPSQPFTDRGCSVEDVLQNWMTTGFPLHGQTPDFLSARYYISPKDFKSMKASIYYAGGVYIGVRIPKWITTLNPYTWTLKSNYPYNQDTIFLHALWCFGYNENGLWCVAWGRKVLVEWDWLLQFCDEAHGLISLLDWQSIDGFTPNGKRIDAVKKAIISNIAEYSQSNGSLTISV